MEKNDISELLGKIGNILGDDQLFYWNVKIEWESIAKIYDIFDEVGIYENGVFKKLPTDMIIANIFKKDKFLFKNVLTYILTRYDLPILKECLNEYETILDNDLGFTLDNEVDSTNLKIFISFNNNDSEEAVKIQEFFKNCGVKCFLSKTDMEISEEYKKRTFNEICNSNIFIYLLSENSKASDWCDQEMGMAYIKHKLGNSEIFIVSHDGMEPYGFLSSFNLGFTYHSNYLYDIARKIDEKYNSQLVSKITDYYNELVNTKVKELFTVRNFNSAKNLLYFINKRSEFLDDKQIEMICDATIQNQNLYMCYICKEPLIEILDTHKDRIDNELYQKVFNAINPRATKPKRKPIPIKQIKRIPRQED